VYCAGVGDLLDANDLSGEPRVFAVNLLGAVETATAILPSMMAAGRGHFIGLSSIGDQRSLDAPSYSASKAGLSSYLEALALALRSRGVMVTNLRLGFVDTKMAKAKVRPFMMTTERAVDVIAHCLRRRPATTHWAVVDQARALYPNVHWKADRFVTESENVFCGGGLYASIDLSLYLVEHYCGHEVAVQTAKALLLETPRIWQSTYAAQPPRSGHDDEAIQRAQAWLFEHFRKPIDLEALASKAGMSTRNFARRFKAATGEAPLAYIHRLRIDSARHYLENAQRSVREISSAVGYEDLAFFRNLFRRHTGTSPREYRARFGVRRVAASA